MRNEDNKNDKIPSFPKKPTLSFYLVIFTLLACSRLFDMTTTYLATPNLSMESNIMVTTLRLEWSLFIVINILMMFLIFLLFRLSWSRFSNRKEKEDEHNIKSRNIAFEIGLTLPIYVIITGYFQGMMNILIYLEWVLISFTHFPLLYPIIVGGIFGSVSLYLTKKIMHSRHSNTTKYAHKVMLAKKAEAREGHNFLISSRASSSNPWIRISEEDRF